MTYKERKQARKKLLDGDWKLIHSLTEGKAHYNSVRNYFKGKQMRRTTEAIILEAYRKFQQSIEHE